MEIRILRADDQRGEFRSSDPDLERYFHKYADQNQFREKTLQGRTATSAGTPNRVERLGVSVLSPPGVLCSKLKTCFLEDLQFHV